jgi:hypothetical protein
LAVHPLMRRPDTHEMPVDSAGNVLIRFDDRDEAVAVEEDSAERDLGSHVDHCSLRG